jgi:hypothetical protein
MVEDVSILVVEEVSSLVVVVVGNFYDDDNLVHDDGSHDDDNAPRDGDVILHGNIDDVHDDDLKADCHVVSPERAVGLLHYPL